MSDALVPGCGLEREAWAARREQWRFVRERLRSAERIGTLLRLVIALGPGVERALAELVESERRCCAHLAWRSMESGDALVLEIAADPGAGVAADSALSALQRALHVVNSPPGTSGRKVSK